MLTTSSGKGFQVEEWLQIQQAQMIASCDLTETKYFTRNIPAPMEERRHYSIDYGQRSFQKQEAMALPLINVNSESQQSLNASPIPTVKFVRK